MPQNTHTHLVGQVQTPAIVFQIIHHPEALLIVPEGLSDAAGQRRLTGVAKGRMSQVMPHGDGLGKILVQAQGPCHGAGDPRDLQRVRHTGAVVIPLRSKEHLGLVHQAAEGLAVHNAVIVPLKAGAHIVVGRLLRPGAA